MKKIFLYALFVLLNTVAFTTTRGQTPNWASAYGVGNGISTPTVKGIATDAAGNTYLTGYFTDTIRFGATKLTAASYNNDIFVAKLDHNGIAQWAKRAGSIGEDLGNGIAVDNVGNVYVTGGVNGVSSLATFGNITFTSIHNIDAFLAKYDASGNIQWVAHNGTGVTNYGERVTVDNANDIYITGEYGLLMFVSKYNSAGANTWTTVATNNSVQVECRAIAVNSAGDLFTGGNYSNQLIMGGVSIPSSNGYDPYLVKLNAATGSVSWIKYLHGNGDDRGYSLAADDIGNVYFHGITISQKLYYGADTIFGNNNGGQVVWLVKYANDGSIVWKRQSTGGDIRGGDVAVDMVGNPYITGYVGGTSTFNFGSLYNSGVYSRAYVVKYTSAGAEQWIKLPTGTNYTFATGIAINSLGEAFVTGTYNGTTIFNAATIYPAVNSGTDIFVAKICMTAIPPIVATGGTALCPGATKILSAPAGFTTYNWSNSTNTQSTSINTAGTYSVTVTNAEGCSASTSITVSLNPAIKIVKVITPVSCYGGNDGAVNITASLGTAPYTYSWNNGALTQNISGLIAATYTVTVTDGAGCTKSMNCVVNQPAAPSTVVAVNGPTTVCNPNTVSLYVVAPSGVGYQWQKSNVDIPGATLSTYNAPITGSYRCKVFYQCGSKQSNVVAVTVKVQLASITPSGQINACINSVVLHTIQGGSVTYQWYLNGVALPGQTNRNDTVWYNPSEIYHVVVTNNVTGCSGTSQYAYLSCLSRTEGEETIVPTVVTVYPNPSAGNFILELNNLQGKDLTITTMDLAGREIETRTIWAADEESSLMIDLTALATGSYFVKISSAENTQVLKLVKQ